MVSACDVNRCQSPVVIAGARAHIYIQLHTPANRFMRHAFGTRRKRVVFVIIMYTYIDGEQSLENAFFSSPE